MANLNGFNPAEFQDDDSFDPLPAGNYEAIITESEMKDTRDGTGKYLKLTWKLIDGSKYDGRLVWENINIINKNPQAVEIAFKTLAKVCKACGINRPVNDSSELHGIPCMIKVSIRPASNGYDESNDVKSHKMIKREVPGVALGAASVPSNNTSAVQPPWKEVQTSF